MSKIIDFFTKKPIEEVDTSYKKRKEQCIQNALTQGSCKCVHCVENDMLANKLAEISKWLMTEHSMKTKRRTYYGDWLEVVFLAALKVEKHINSVTFKQ